MPEASLKGTDYARDIIATMERETISRDARKRMAETAIQFGRYDGAAIMVWRDYLRTFEVAK